MTEKDSIAIREIQQGALQNGKAGSLERQGEETPTVPGDSATFPLPISQPATNGSPQSDISVPVRQWEVEDLDSQIQHWEEIPGALLFATDSVPLATDVDSMPKYYKETFFSKDSIMAIGEHAGRYGIAGDPVPYSIRTDDFLTSILLVFLLLLLHSIRRSARLFRFQARNFFRSMKRNSVMEKESVSDVKYLWFIELHTVLIFSLVFFSYSKEYISATYITYSEYTLMAIYFSIFLALLLFVHSVEGIVNGVFAVQQQKRQWTTTKTMLNAAMGIMLTPMLLFMAYFGLPVHHTLIYTLCIVIFVKILLLYKCFQIFFNKKSDYLRIFLYFCTLEIIPLIITWSVLHFVANFLKVNY